jgi:hypothetical protein
LSQNTLVFHLTTTNNVIGTYILVANDSHAPYRYDLSNKQEEEEEEEERKKKNRKTGHDGLTVHDRAIIQRL